MNSLTDQEATATGTNYRPFISVCIPVYNAEPYLAEAIDSLIAQTYDNYEIIISDNCSTDRSWSIAQRYANSPGIRLYRNKWNIEFAGNLQRVTSLAKGDFLIVHAADDIAEANAFERLVTTIQELDVDIGNLVITSDFYFSNQQGKPQSITTVDSESVSIKHIPISREGRLGPTIQRYRGRALLVERMPTLSSFAWLGSTLISRQIYDQVEGCISNHWINPDKHFIYKVLSLDPDVVWLREPLFHWRQHESNQNSQQRGSGVLKYLVDEYAYTFEFSLPFLETFGISRGTLVEHFVDSDCLDSSLRELAIGSRRLGFRHLCFALATYPERAFRNPKTYWAILIWATGFVGSFSARVVYRSQIWRTWWRRS